MYEVFIDDKNKVIETGQILFLISNLVEKIILYITLIKKVVKVIMIRMVKALKKHL